MDKRISIILVIMAFFLLSGCGFKSMYKFVDDELAVSNYSLKIVNQVSREIQEEIDNTTQPKDNLVYEVLLNIQEEQTPLIINTNGTVAKYRIEVSISFETIQLIDGEIVSSGVSRGFAQYDVGESEFSNDDLKKRMTQNAMKNALQIMKSKVESSIAEFNAN